MMKTLAGWKKSGLNLEKYLRPGDEINDELYFYMLECGNPVFWRAGVFAMVDPSCEAGGELYYSAFQDRGAGYRFLGNQSIDALNRFSNRVVSAFN